MRTRSIRGLTRLTIAQLAEHLTVVDLQTSECPWFDSEW